jgi:hypothetical protein
VATPSVGALQRVAAALQAGGADVALGGSGLLYSLGLGDSVRDWDLTTDTPWQQVESALSGFEWQLAPFGDGDYRSRFRVSVRVGAAEIDLIGRFAVGDVHLPTIPSGEWNGVPVGAPEVWAVAYRLIGRHAKADLLHGWVRQHGARTFVAEYLLQGVENPNIRGEIALWPTRTS